MTLLKNARTQCEQVIMLLFSIAIPDAFCYSMLKHKFPKAYASFQNQIVNISIYLLRIYAYPTY